jgi:hypothetical protein
MNTSESEFDIENTNIMTTDIMSESHNIVENTNDDNYDFIQLWYQVLHTHFGININNISNIDSRDRFIEIFIKINGLELEKKILSKKINDLINEQDLYELDENNKKKLHSLLINCYKKNVDKKKNTINIEVKNTVKISEISAENTVENTVENSEISEVDIVNTNIHSYHMNNNLLISLEYFYYMKKISEISVDIVNTNMHSYDINYNLLISLEYFYYMKKVMNLILEIYFVDFNFGIIYKTIIIDEFINVFRRVYGPFLSTNDLKIIITEMIYDQNLYINNKKKRKSILKILINKYESYK